jgi:hypothetical protein
LLSAADVAITTSSTLSIDAACVDTPIVNVFFDGLAKVDPAVSARRFTYYTHYARLLQTGGIASTRSFDEFVLAVNRYLNDPASDRSGRQAMVRQQLGSLDGQAGRRTAEALLEIIRGPILPESTCTSRSEAHVWEGEAPAEPVPQSAHLSPTEHACSRAPADFGEVGLR